MTAALPRPPAGLAARALPIRSIAAGTELPRFHPREHGAIHFNRTDAYRWNAPDGSFGVCYVGLDLAASFAETFLRDPGASYLDIEVLRARALTHLVATRDLRLVEMLDNGLKRLGATAFVCSCLPYDLPQAWAKALHDHPDAPDGILYRASHDDGRLCAAVFDRARNALGEGRKEENLPKAPWLYGMMDRYEMGLPPGTTIP